MRESAGQPPDDREAEALPELHRALVAADDEIELHGAKAALLGMRQRMCAHGARHTAAHCAWGDYIAAIGHMRATALLIGLEIIGADDQAVALGDENLMHRRMPVGQRRVARDVAWNGVGLAGAEGRFE